MQYAEHMPFSKITLAWAFQQQISYEAIDHYIQSYHPQSVCGTIKSDAGGASESSSGIQAAPLPFMAVEGNCAWSVRLLLEVGADPTTVLYPFKVSALAFAIIYAMNEFCNMTGASHCSTELWCLVVFYSPKYVGRILECALSRNHSH